MNWFIGLGSLFHITSLRPISLPVPIIWYMFDLSFGDVSQIWNFSVMLRSSTFSLRLKKYLVYYFLTDCSHTGAVYNHLLPPTPNPYTKHTPSFIFLRYWNHWCRPPDVCICFQTHLIVMKDSPSSSFAILRLNKPPTTYLLTLSYLLSCVVDFIVLHSLSNPPLDVVPWLTFVEDLMWDTPAK